MKKIILPVCLVIIISFCGISFANDVQPIPITAEEAFDAVQTQTDPISGESTNVALVDVRTRAEYFWVGAASQVDEIIMINGGSFFPENGKVKLSWSGLFLSFRMDGRKKCIRVKKVSEILLSPIALSIPFLFWNEDIAWFEVNENFANNVEALEAEYDVLIFFCGTGGRSGKCFGAFNTSLFDEIYEIDQPDGKNGYGGFEGDSYSNIYNGYRGFPGRFTKIQDHPSVSWKDTGLPVMTNVNPLAK